MKVNTHIIFSSYIKAGILLHAVTLIELSVFTFFFIRLDLSHWLNEGNFFLKFLILIFCIGMPTVAQLDARSRFQNYKLVKDYLWQYGFEPKVIKLFIRSRCQRDAVFAAANELRMQKQCKAFFGKYGYKWYHFFPDRFFSNPGILFTKHFWSQTLFAKTYHPKYDFRKIHINTPKIKKPSRKMAVTSIS